MRVYLLLFRTISGEHTYLVPSSLYGEQRLALIWWNSLFWVGG